MLTGIGEITPGAGKVALAGRPSRPLPQEMVARGRSPMLKRRRSSAVCAGWRAIGLTQRRMYHRKFWTWREFASWDRFPAVAQSMHSRTASLTA